MLYVIIGGGWSGEDRRMGTEGIRQLPTSMKYNTTALPEIAQFGDDIATAVFYIRHSQGWNVFWWEAGAYYDLSEGNITLGKGGYQGGRVWTKTTDVCSISLVACTYKYVYNTYRLTTTTHKVIYQLLQVILKTIGLGEL